MFRTVSGQNCDRDPHAIKHLHTNFSANTFVQTNIQYPQTNISANKCFRKQTCANKHFLRQTYLQRRYYNGEPVGNGGNE